MTLPKKKLVSRNERKGLLNAEKEETPGKEKLRKGEVRIGMSKQISIKVADFQYNKIGCWMERVVEDNERDINANMDDISVSIDDRLEIEVSDFWASMEKEKKKKR